MSEEIGAILKRTREKAGLSQTELAHRLGFESNATVSRWEHGARAVLATDIVRIAEACGTDAHDLFREIHAAAGREGAA